MVQWQAVAVRQRFSELVEAATGQGASTCNAHDAKPVGMGLAGGV
jgi:hypothetical protein